MIAQEPDLDFAPVKVPRPRLVAAMFADLDDFTRTCLEFPPESVLALIAYFQRLVHSAIASFEGKVNSFQGDGVFATFAEAAGKANCATRSLSCALTIVHQIQALKPYFGKLGDRSTSVSVGLEYGHVWTCTTDLARRFGPTLIGDAVNVASKLEQRARALSATIVVGDSLIQKARRESGPDDPTISQFVSVRPLFIDGRHIPLDVWVLSRFDEITLQVPRTRPTISGKQALRA
jgi:class 3 adenylate cyclase